MWYVGTSHDISSLLPANGQVRIDAIKINLLTDNI